MSVDHGTLKDLGELALIRRISELVGPPSPAVVGIGDDCAVLPFPFLGFSGAGSILVTTDTMVDGRHFRLDYSSAEDVGWKLLAVSVSDIASMGGVPRAAVVSLTVPRSAALSTVEGFYRGLRACAALEHVEIAGGDTVEGDQIVLGLTLLGSIDRPPVLRLGARPGDRIFVSGAIGSAGAGLALLRRGEGAADEAEDAPLLARHRAPVARTLLGRMLAREGGASSMIDVSDGLLQDSAHIARMSGVDIEIDLTKLPRLPRTAALRSLLESATDGDDYELLFTAPQSFALDPRAPVDLAVTEIGRVLEKRGTEGTVLACETAGGAFRVAAELCSEQGVSGRGYEHFKAI